MEELLKTIYEFIINSVNSSSFLGPVFACFLIFIESIIPVLPLFVFITVIFLKYGAIFGFILSWLFTILGCMSSYFLVKYLANKFFKFDGPKLKKIISMIKRVSFPELVTIIAIPFTPAFLINIAAGMAKMPTKKFILAIMIGKISLILFWGFIGTSLVDSLNNPIIMLKIVIIVLIAYIISFIVNKKFNIN